MAADLAADFDNRLYEQHYSGQEVPDHLAPYSIVRYYYNITPSRVLVVEPHTMPISHGGPRVVLHGNGNCDLEVLEDLMAKNPYWVNKGVLMTSKVPSGMLNYETYQIFILSEEDKQKNNLLRCTSTMMVTLKMGYTTMVPQPPIQEDEISSTTSDDEDYHSDGIRWAQVPVNIEQENYNLLQRLDQMQAELDAQLPEDLRDNPQ